MTPDSLDREYRITLSDRECASYAREAQAQLRNVLLFVRRSIDEAQNPRPLQRLANTLDGIIERDCRGVILDYEDGEELLGGAGHDWSVALGAIRQIDAVARDLDGYSALGKAGPAFSEATAALKKAAGDLYIELEAIQEKRG